MQLDGRELRNALGRFATGVCLITTVNEEGEPLALTANSFSSVSLDPPLVLWSLQNNSDVYHIYSGAPRYAINVLSDGQQELSNRYARKGDHGLEEGHFRLGESGVPIIEGALLSLECTLEASHPGGDHIILVGRVEGVHLSEGDPLLFYGGAYRALA